MKRAEVGLGPVASGVSVRHVAAAAQLRSRRFAALALPGVPRVAGPARPSVQRLAALGLLCALAASPASAAVCGGAVPCKCDANVQGTTKLDRDLVDCGRVGLRLSSGATLDCAGHEIRGKGTKSSEYGIKIDAANDVQVRNCRVSGFARGIRVRGGERVLLEGNTAEGNTIGIELAGSTESGEAIDHTVVRNHVRQNEQDGIHVGSGSVRAQVLENQLIKNGQEGLYVLWCTDCAVIGNTIESAGTSAIYHKHTSGAYYADNTIRGSIVHLRGESAHNLFARNILEGAGYVFEGYTNEGYAHDPGWVRVPHDNEIVGGSISGAKTCFRFQGAHDNRARDVLGHHCRPVSTADYAGRTPVGNLVEVVEVGDDFDADEIANASDRCTDRDGDGFGDPGFRASTCPLDNCREVWNPDQKDGDGDGVGDACDRCAATKDPAQRDRDGDGAGDACDSCVDADADGHGERGGACGVDNCPQHSNPDQLDSDGDGVGDPCDRCPHYADAEAAADPTRPATCGVTPPEGLSFAQAESYRAAIAAFTRVEKPETGLGPSFNGASCAECHSQPGAGGSSARVVTVFGRQTAEGFDPMADQGGPLLQTQGIRTVGCSVPNEAVPDGAAQHRRQSPPLYGLGLLEAVPESAITAQADPDDRDGDGISGRVNRAGGKVGRFGWKAEQPTLAAFAAKSLLEEIGITSPARPHEEKRQGKETPCDRVEDPEDDGRHVAALAEFVRLLPPLPVKARGEAEARGERAFRGAGCTGCHVEAFETGASELAPLDRKVVRAYSDLLLHDMGPTLADGVVAGEASGREYRTAPLWGAAASAPYLHDGRAPSLEEAIALHDGEAAGARKRYLEMPKGDRQALVAFLKSL